uniref:Serine peptidase inhibitor, Kazal type 13 n=1 Tax=Nannospalax galili TaxID=1026970 RepID=A0A8C6RFL5_NANGA
MRSNGSSLYRITFFLVLSTLAHTAFSAIVRERNGSRWPKPPYKLYYPIDPDYEANCPDVVAYVCATNGFTYKNECFFCIDR